MSMDIGRGGRGERRRRALGALRELGSRADRERAGEDGGGEGPWRHSLAVDAAGEEEERLEHWEPGGALEAPSGA